MTESEEIRVLLVEDNPSDVLAMREYLGELTHVQFQLHWAERLADALDFLRANSYDVILLDLGLPDSQGVETFARVHAQASEVPILVLTGLDDDVMGLKAMQHGAQDYLVKNQVQSLLLGKAIRYAIERANLIAARKHTEARLSLATQVLKAGIWEWSLNTDEVIWDATMREIYGLKRDCAVDSRLWLNTVVPEDRPGAETILQEVRAAKSEVSGDFRIVTPKGSLRYIHAAYGVILDELGQVASMIGVNIDVTERKLSELKVIQRSAQLEAANRELNVVVRRLGLATDALHAGIWDWDVRTNILKWDDRMFEIYGIPRNTRMDYTTWAGTVVAEDLPAVEVMLQKVIASRSQDSAEFRISLPNGTVRYIQAAVGTILDDAGEVVRVVGINIETTVRRFNEDLEHLVDRRTAQLRAANKELEEFAYVASHDLKAPLRVIDNASKWLEEDLEEHLTDETREHLTLLRSRVGRMEKLLDDLLDYARIGKTTDNRYSETIAGNVLMGNVLALLDPGELTLSVSPRFADIQVCRMPLQQILMNLIGNAIKHHDKKKGHIEVAVEDNGDGYTFTVRDDGPGIPAQFHDQVFKMFQTLKPRDQVEGSGMGLALVRKNAELFGGVIQLESTEGEGSTFRLTWPRPQSLKKEAI